MKHIQRAISFLKKHVINDDESEIIIDIQTNYPNQYVVVPVNNNVPQPIPEVIPVAQTYISNPITKPIQETMPSIKKQRIFQTISSPEKISNERQYEPSILYRNNPDVCYYKITNKKETHHGYVYHDGLNILNEPFNEADNCGPGGFYFTTKQYIYKFFKWGIYVREISLPIDDPDLKVHWDKTKCKFRTNKIILGKKYSLFNPKIYKKFGYSIIDNKYILAHASALGYIKFLNWWKRDGIALKYSSRAMDLASKYGQIAVLNWWRRSGFRLEFSHKAMDVASKHGNIAVLNWWILNFPKKKLKYSINAIIYAANDIVRIRWIQSKLPFRIPISERAKLLSQKVMLKNLNIKYYYDTLKIIY